MVKIGNIKYLIVVAFLLLGVVSYAQEPTISAQVSSQNVTVNEVFTVQIILNHDMKFNYPEFDGFQVGAGQKSYSSQVEVRGNQMVKKEQHVTVHPIKALKIGTFVIGKFSVRFNGKLYETEPITISVKEAPKVNATINDHLNEQFYADYVINKTDAYVGEPIYIYKKMYSKYGMDDISEPKGGEVLGSVQVKNIGKDGIVKTNRETIKGNTYISASFDNQVLFPMKEGSVQLGSYTSSISFGGFFGDQTQVKALPRTIKILPLPSNAPNDFTGGVGRFKLDSKVNKTKVEVGDVVQLDVKILGSGNLQLIGEPKLELSEYFEMYGDPVIEDTFDIDFQGMNGTVKYTYLLRAKSGGETKIPEVHFSYFDLKSKSYKSVKSDAISIEIEGENKIAIKPNEKEPKTDSEEIPSKLEEQFTEFADAIDVDGLWTSSIWFKAIPAPLVLGFIFGFAYKRREENKEENLTKSKIKKANKNASQVFLQAKKELNEGNHAGFYEAIHQATISYLSDKFNVSKASLSKMEIKELLISKGVEIALVDKLIASIEQCEMARFAAQDSVGNQSFFTDVSELINQIDTKLS